MPPTTIHSLIEAIEAYQANAAQMFTIAQGELDHPAAPREHETADDVRNKSQGKLGAALSQLSNAEAMRSAQKGRDGYEQVVALMTTTAATAAAICNYLQTFVNLPLGTVPPTPSLTPGSTDLQQNLDIIKTLTGALEALARISPSAVWQKPPGSGGVG